MKNYPITTTGYNKLQDELKRCKKEMTEISKRIEVARELGDLSENAEYHTAKDDQGLMNARIIEIEDKLVSANVIDPTKLDKHKIYFGSTAKLVDVDTDKEVVYQIVSEEEVDVNSGRISINSPIARGLIGKTVGDSFEISVPSGDREFEILEIL